MKTIDSKLYSDISALSSIDKLMLVEWILNDLDKADPEIDKLWTFEAKKRLDAYEAKKIKTIDLQTALQKHVRKRTSR